MASVLHGSARTTPRIRAELQASKESARSLAARYDLNPKTVRKWRQRTTTADAPMGPKAPKSTVLTPAEEAIVVAFRQKTLLPLDDVLGCLRDTIPNLSRSALHRCLQRHGISRLPKEEASDKRNRFKSYQIGYVHIDSCELRHTDGKLVMFLAIDRVSKFTYVEFHNSAGKKEGAAFLRNVVAAFPYKIHTVLTDNGMAFADLPKNREGPSRRFLGPHIFDRVCIEQGIEHRLTKPDHPWTNGQAERMNRTIKDATVKVFHYEDLESLKAHVLTFVTAYNFAKHLKALRWRTPGRRAAEVVERPVAGRLCGEDCVLYAHFLRPELPSVAVRTVGTQRTSAIRQNAGEGAKGGHAPSTDIAVRPPGMGARFTGYGAQAIIPAR